LGGVEVCLKHAVYDSYSGADFPAGRQTLDAEQALAFVRQRHGLENGDLDRTHRQQAFLSSVMRQLQDSGSFTDLGRLKRLMAVARKDIVLSSGWEEKQFRRMGALAGGAIEYRTLPVVRYDTINGQDVNIVDPLAIKKEVAAAFGTAPSAATISTAPPNPSTIIDVINAGSINGLASQVSRTLKKDGYTAGAVRDRFSGEPSTTTVEYGPGAESDARTVATLLGIDASDRPNSKLKARHVKVVVDSNYSMASQDESTTTSSAASSYRQSNGYATSTEPTPDQGAPIDGGGVPCVN
jgi:hypothetical protein